VALIENIRADTARCHAASVEGLAFYSPKCKTAVERTASASRRGGIANNQPDSSSREHAVVALAGGSAEIGVELARSEFERREQSLIIAVVPNTRALPSVTLSDHAAYARRAASYRHRCCIG